MNTRERSWSSISGAGLALAAGLVTFAVSTNAAADTLIIRNPGDHSRYSFEAEPHALLGLFNPPGEGRGTGLGLGFRGTLPLLDNGFVPSINNSIGIGFGLDWVHYGRGDNYCVRDNGRAACATTTTRRASTTCGCRW